MSQANAPEHQALQSRIHELEQQLAHLEHALRAEQTHTIALRTILDAIPAPIFYKDAQGTYLGCNRAFEEYLGKAKSEIVGAGVYDLSPPDLAQVYQQADNDLMESRTTQRYEALVRYADGSNHEVLFTKSVFFNEDGQLGGLVGVMLDITERKKAEQAIEQQREQAEIIQAQEMLLEELSTPLIPISDDVVIMPLIGRLDSRRSQQVLSTLLEGVGQHQARLAIIDITGVLVVDTQVAHALVQSAQAVGLLGARVVLTGIRPEVAQTLVGLGVDLGSIITKSSLQDGIGYALSTGG